MAPHFLDSQCCSLSALSSIAKIRGKLALFLQHPHLSPFHEKKLLHGSTPLLGFLADAVGVLGHKQGSCHSEPSLAAKAQES